MVKHFHFLSDAILKKSYSISFYREQAYLFNCYNDVVCSVNIDCLHTGLIVFDMYCFVNSSVKVDSIYYAIDKTEVDKDFAKSLRLFASNNSCIEFKIACETATLHNTFFVMGCKDNVVGKVIKKTLSFELSHVIELMSSWIGLSYPPQTERIEK